MKYQKFSKTALIFITASALLLNCKKKDKDPAPVQETPAPVVRTTTYQLEAVQLGKTGTVTFTESGTNTIVNLSINNITSGTYPAHIHFNSVAEGGGISDTLNNVDSKGKSSTVIKRSYSELIAFDGHINVHQGSGYVAQGDIGGNVLTGDSKEYPLTEVAGSGVGGGKVVLKKRANNNTLIQIMLNNTGTTESYPSEIWSGSVDNDFPIHLLTLKNKVSGSLKESRNTIRTLGSKSYTYDKLLDQALHVRVYSTDSTKVIAHGNIGK